MPLGRFIFGHTLKTSKIVPPPDGIYFGQYEWTAGDIATVESAAGFNALLDTYTQAKVKVLGGVDGSQYKITFLVTLDDGSILEEDLLMNVKDR